MIDIKICENCKYKDYKFSIFKDENCCVASRNIFSSNANDQGCFTFFKDHINFQKNIHHKCYSKSMLWFIRKYRKHLEPDKNTCLFYAEQFLSSNK